MPTKKSVTVSLVQTTADEDLNANLQKNLKLARNAAKQGARIVCLQELYRSIYFPQYKKTAYEKFAETIPGESTRAFSKLAKELGIVIIVPLFEKAKTGRHYNSAAIMDHTGKLLETYRKIHIPQDPLFYEKNYFAPGESGYKIYKTKFATFAVLICYDQWFPEAARMAALEGAEIIFYPTAIGYILGEKAQEGDWHESWETVMRGHAISNGVHVAAVNRVGREDKLKFWGQSFVCDSFGKILKRASASKEEVLSVKTDLSLNRLVRQGWGFLKNRRPDTYKFSKG